MFKTIIIITLIIVGFVLLMAFPIIVIEKSSKETKKKFKLTRIACYCFVIPILFLFSLVNFSWNDFINYSEWVLIYFFGVYAVTIAMLTIPMAIDELLYAILQKKNKGDK